MEETHCVWKNIVWKILEKHIVSCLYSAAPTHTSIFAREHTVSLISLSFCSSAWTRRCDSKWPEGATGSAWLNCHFMCSATRIHLDTNTHRLSSFCLIFFLFEPLYGVLLQREWLLMRSGWVSMAGCVTSFCIYCIMMNLYLYPMTFGDAVLKDLVVALGFVLVFYWTYLDLWRKGEHLYLMRLAIRYHSACICC